MLKKSLLTQCVLMVLLTLVLLWTVPATATDAVKNVYICGCGPACGCNMMAEKPGTCPCGKPMTETQVLKEDADKVYVCACGDRCKCALNQAEPTKCSCGKELRAYPKAGNPGCAHAMPSGCDKPCDKPCGKKQPTEAK